MRFLRRSLTGLFLLSLTVGLLAWAGHTVFTALKDRMADEGFARPANERVFAVNAVTYRAATVRPVLSTFGEVRSRRTLELRATASGTIVELADDFVDGGRVETGELLMRIDPAEAQSALSRARTDLTEAEAELRDAARAVELAHEELAAAEAQAELRRKALARQRDLRERGVGTEAAVETAELAAAASDQAVVSRKQALAQAEARLELARTGLERREVGLADAERHLEDTAIHAAFSGTLGEVSVVEGGLVSNNERIGILTDPDRLEVSFRLSTAQYARLLDEGGELISADVRIYLDVLGVDLEAEGVITRESASVGEDQTGRLLFARLGAARGFRPGDFVTVEIVEPPLHGVARLPATALDADGGVLVIGPDGRLEAARVTVLRRQGDDVLVRAEGLEGEQIVAARSPLLGEGIKVRPIRRGEAVEEQAQNRTVTLSDERRAQLVAFVQSNDQLPDEARARLLAQLALPEVPVRVVERLEARMGG